MRFEWKIFSVEILIFIFLPIESETIKLKDAILFATNSSAAKCRTFVGVFVRQFDKDVCLVSDLEWRLFVKIKFEIWKTFRFERKRHVEWRQLDRRQDVAILRLSCRKMICQQNNEFDANKRLWRHLESLKRGSIDQKCFFLSMENIFQLFNWNFLFHFEVTFSDTTLENSLCLRVAKTYLKKRGKKIKLSFLKDFAKD